jgi:hypothetical protein
MRKKKSEERQYVLKDMRLFIFFQSTTAPRPREEDMEE